VSIAQVDAWQTEMAGVVRDELTKQGRKHLVFGTQAFDVSRLVQELEASFAGPPWDAVNVHPNPFIRWKGRAYKMGDFMSRELTLAQVRDFCQAVHSQPRPVVLDEDNAASMYRDEVGWTIHRKRAWTTVLSGAHYDYIDFSITVGRESGTPASGRAIRAWMKHLSDFIHSFDFIKARPLANWVRNAPATTVVSSLAVEGKDYAAYLADAREATDPAWGQPLEGKVSLVLPPGSFEVRLYSPAAGSYSPAIAVQGGQPARIDLPSFRHDVVIRARRR
jgi:hypothetical protein